ncbi:MAG: ATP-binding protein, partial [Sciscionella sp.]
MSSSGGHEAELGDFCARLRRLRLEAGTPTLEWLARQPRCPGKSQLSKIFRGEVERVPDADVIGGIVAACARRASERGIRPMLPTDERQWEIERAIIERMLNHTSSSLPRPAATESIRVVPAQLPADVSAFTGRTRELAALDELSVADSSAVIISAVSGTAGVGKTALALRWAHRVRHEFPDGQLYVNLRGYDPDQPVSPGDALASFLRGLGLAGQDIPRDVDERAATYRSLLDSRRMLVVLDNAGNVEQVRPLLPGTPSCQVVVTSRDSLAGLVVGHGARRVDLDLLAHDEAVALLRTLLAERVDAEPAAAALLAERCARLPLALRIATEYAAARPSTSLADIAAELADEQQRLDLLDAGDPRTAVRGVFSWSYRQLPTEASRVFRLLGLHPGADCDSYAAAALAGTDRATARHSLDVLARAHLVQPTGRDRYALHDLLRAYAAELAKTQDVPQEAVIRLFDHYVATTAAAIDILYPEERHLRPKTQIETATPAQPLTDQAEARNWLGTESNNLAAICAYTTDNDWPNYATQLSALLWNYVDNMGQHAYAIAIHSHALRNSRRTGHRSAEAHALTYLGNALFWHGDYQEAYEHVNLAVTIACEIGDLPCEADALTALGVFFRRQGYYRQAHEVFGKVLTIEDQIGRQQSATTVLLNLG